MSSHSLQEEDRRDLHRLRELAELEDLLVKVEEIEAEACKRLDEILRKFDGLSW